MSVEWVRGKKLFSLLPLLERHILDPSYRPAPLHSLFERLDGGKAPKDVFPLSTDTLAKRFGVLRLPHRVVVGGEVYVEVVYSYSARYFEYPVQLYRGALVRYPEGEPEKAEVLSFPFTKFFNLNEYPFWREEVVGEPESASIKADGTLIVGFFDPLLDRWRFMTKKMVEYTPTAKTSSEEPVRLEEVWRSRRRIQNPYVRGFLIVAGERAFDLPEGYTHMFELVATGKKLEWLRRQIGERIDVGSPLAGRFHHNELEVYYITSRRMRDCFLLPFSMRGETGLQKKFRETPYIPGFSTWDEARRFVSALRNSKEGIVVFTDLRVPVKLKVRIAFEASRFPRSLPKLIEFASRLVVLGIADDVLPYLGEEGRRLIQTADRLYREHRERIEEATEKCWRKIRELREKGKPEKTIRQILKGEYPSALIDALLNERKKDAEIFLLRELLRREIGDKNYSRKALRLISSS